MANFYATLVNATGWSIIHSLWQGALIFLLLHSILILNPNLKPRLKHNLSFIGMCSMLLWFIQTFYVQFNSGMGVGMAGEPTVTFTDYPDVVWNLSSSVFTATEQIFPLIALVYTLGLITQVAILLAGYHKVNQIKNKGISAVSDELTARFRTLALGMGISRVIIFVKSAKVYVPTVVGYLNPMILLPASVLSQFTPQQLEAIIIHELAHIRRNDYVVNMLVVSIETILFFNPFVWLAGRSIDTERENACDDLVLELTGHPLDYALTLLELEKVKKQDQLLSMAITGKSYSLLNRIKRITNGQPRRLNLKFQLFAILAVLSSILSLAWSPAENDLRIDNVSKNSTRVLPHTKSDMLKIGPTVLLSVNKKAYDTKHISARLSRVLTPDTNASISQNASNENAGQKSSNLTIAAASTDNYNSAFYPERSVIWLDKSGKLISADPKIIYYSQTLSGYTIDKDGNILDGNGTLLDKLEGGKPIIKIDSTGNTSQNSTHSVTGILGNPRLTTAKTLTGFNKAYKPGSVKPDSTKNIRSTARSYDVTEFLKQNAILKAHTTGVP